MTICTVWETLKDLQSLGLDAYLVGGAVRDYILGSMPKDLDFLVVGEVEDIRATLGETYLTTAGSRFVLNKNMPDGQLLQIDVVEDHFQLLENLGRRDFTINTLLAKSVLEIEDYFGGVEDIIQKQLRAPHDKAMTSITDDPIRILRALRFSAKYDLTIGDYLRSALVTQRHLLAAVSKERIAKELTEMLTLKDIFKVQSLMLRYGLWKVLAPEVAAMINCDQNTPWHRNNVYLHSVSVMEKVKHNLDMRLAAMLHDVGKPLVLTTDENRVDHFYGHAKAGTELVPQILRKLGFESKSLQREVSTLVQYHMHKDHNPRSMRRLLGILGESTFRKLLELQEADVSSGSGYMLAESLEDCRQAQTMLQEVIDSQQAVNIKDLAIGGKELIAKGYTPGPGIGIMLKALLDEVLEDPAKNTPEYLLSKV